MASNIPSTPPPSQPPIPPPSPKPNVFKKVIAAQTPQEAARQLTAEEVQEWIEEPEKNATEQKVLETFLTVLQPLTPSVIKTTIREIANGLRALYIEAPVGEKLATLLEKNLEEGKYNSLVNPLALQRALNEEIRSLSSDQHLTVEYSYPSIPQDSPYRTLQGPSPEEDKRILDKEEYKKYFRPHFGVVKVEILPENIGYLKIDKFAPAHYPETQKAIEGAMKTVANSKALIIDLRDNKGGFPETVSLIASYLFDQRVLINETYGRNGKTASYYAHPEDFPARFGGGKPIFILTGPKTFSAAEELAYDLQALGRAKIIGKTTQGGARPTRPYEAGDHFYINISHEESRNPYKNGANWEGTGVQPDIESEDPVSKAIEFIRQSM